jgi:hypothetical protein
MIFARAGWRGLEGNGADLAKPGRHRHMNVHPIATVAAAQQIDRHTRQLGRDVR